MRPEDEVAAGTRCSEGHILRRCDGEHGEADDACNDYGGDTYADGRPGLTMTKYVERFGGYGRARDFGHVVWQVAMIMDHLQMENWQGAKDATALLSVCLEQTALDGMMDVGLLLSLSEDPPSGVFTNRSLAPLPRGKSFAPLASQAWITVARSYIKELDLISQKRADLTGAKSQGLADVPTPKVKPKPQPKWKKKKRGAEDAEET